MIIKTWNQRPFELNEILEGVDNNNLYFTMTYGWMLAIGHGVHKDTKKGDEILLSMFDTEFNNEAKYLYAQSIYFQRKEYTGREVELIDRETTILEELAKNDFSPALFQLGLKLQYGVDDIIQIDFDRAMLYYKGASKLGHIHAKKKLWSIWFEGIGLRGRLFRLMGAILVFPYGIYSLVKYGIHDPRAHY